MAIIAKPISTQMSGGGSFVTAGGSGKLHNISPPAKKVMPNMIEAQPTTKPGLMKNGTTVTGQADVYGTELADILRENGIECEFADPDYLVLMLTPEIKREELARLCEILCAVPVKPPIFDKAPRITCGEKVMSVRDSLFSASEMLDAKNAVGRVLSAPSVSCPPAVPIAVCGERLDENSVRCFEYYGIDKISVVK